MAAFALTLSAAPASAATITDRPLLFGFDGSDSTIGGFDKIGAVAVDYATGDVYALNAAGEGKGPGPFDGDRAICKFDAAGNAKNFTAGGSAGKSCLTGADTPGEAFGVEGFFSESREPDLAADNSGGPTQGRIYVMEAGGPVHAFAPSGTYLWTLSVAGAARGIAVGPTGHLWVGGASEARKFANTGSPPAQIDSIPITSGNKSVGRLALDGSGEDLYVPLRELHISAGARGLHRYDTASKAFDPPPLTDTMTRAVAVDQSGPAGHVFGLQGENFDPLTPFAEYDASGTEVGLFGGDLIGDGRGLAYNPALDRVYVSDGASNTVKAFAPEATGTVPDGAMDETDEIGRNAATLHGSINPQGVPNSYRFETTVAETQRLGVDAAGGTFSLIAPNNLDPGEPHEKFLAFIVVAEGGTFLLQYQGDATAPVPFDAPGNAPPDPETSGPDSVQEALESLPAFVPGDLTVTKVGPGQWNVEFGAAFQDPPQISIFGPGLFGDGNSASEANGQQTAPLPYDASPTALEGALESLQAIGAGNVSLTGTPADGAGGKGQYDITFTGERTFDDLAQLQVYGERLSGGAKSAMIATVTQGEGWSQAEPSPPACLTPAPPLAQDNSVHQASCKLSGLSAGTAYHARLVGENTTNQLKSYSQPTLFKTLPPPAPTVEGLQISAITTESAHVEATIDPQQDKTSWRVLSAHLSDATQAQCEALPASSFKKAAEGTIPAEEPGTVGIEADITGLAPGQTTCARVLATNNAGTGGADQVFQTTAIPPSGLETSYAAPRLDTSARINGFLIPEGDATFSYRFELSEDGGATWTELPLRQSSLNGKDPTLISEKLEGLKPATEYRYRLAIAENEGGPAASTGDERTFTTRSTTEVTLPAPRGIELVNSPDKGNQNAKLSLLDRDERFISADGEKVLWRVSGGSPGGNTATGDTFLAERTPAGWKSRTLIPPAAEQFGKGAFAYEHRLSTPDLSKFVFFTGKAEGTVSVDQVVRLDDAQNEEILSAQGEVFAGEELTEDGAHVLGRIGDPVQQKDFGDGEPGELISVMPDGSPTECGLPSASDSIWRQLRPGYRRASAADASRVYFFAKPNGECGGRFGLYGRNRDVAQTTLIDPGVEGAREPQLIRASHDGRSVFFVTFSQLDGDDQNEGGDVYRWDEAAGASDCLTCAVPDADIPISPTGGFLQVLVSDDGSHVYFQSFEQLLPGQGIAGSINLYALNEGEVRFIANFGGVLGGFQVNGSQARLSADGEVLVFHSREKEVDTRLTNDAIADPDLEQLYLYDGRNGSLECVSCRTDGPTTHRFGGPSKGSAGVAGLAGDYAVSADGSTVAFLTLEPLVPKDVNGSIDVYEWRNGVRRLVSDGLTEFTEGGAAGPAVGGVDADGSDIVLVLVSPGLTGFERDGLANIYDARIGGGFPLPEEAEHCSGDDCQGSVQPPPSSQPPSSASFAGRGNGAASAKPRRCGPRKVKRRGRCVPKRSKAKAKAQKKTRRGR